jgi:hypothetical protein
MRRHSVTHSSHSNALTKHAFVSNTGPMLLLHRTALAVALLVILASFAGGFFDGHF